MDKKKVVISVDGNVNAGKTTLLQSIVLNSDQKQIQYIPEHSDLLQLVNEGDIHYHNSQDRYLLTEDFKYNIVKKSSADFFLMDRSFVSILAHTVATTSKNSEQRVYVTERLCERVKSAGILIPNCFVFINVTLDLCLKRFNDNYARKGTTPELVEPIYFNRLTSIYSKWVKLVNGYRISKPEDFEINLFNCKSYNNELIIDVIRKISTDYK